MQKKIGITVLSYDDMRGIFPNGWVGVDKYTPFPYDICELKLSNYNKIYKGWYNGKDFDGGKYRHLKDPIVTHWKRLVIRDIIGGI